MVENIISTEERADKSRCTQAKVQYSRRYREPKARAELGIFEVDGLMALGVEKVVDPDVENGEINHTQENRQQPALQGLKLIKNHKMKNK